MTVRRAPPAVPEGSIPPPQIAWGHMKTLWKYVIDGYNGLSVAHAFTHLATGVDALLRPGTPKSLGDSNLVGSGPSYAYEDHVHASGLTVKGDLQGRSTTTTRVPVGAAGQVLTADPSSGTGLSYQDSAGASYARIFMMRR